MFESEIAQSFQSFKLELSLFKKSFAISPNFHSLYFEFSCSINQIFLPSLEDFLNIIEQ